jgi:hypothetical protein
MPWPAWILILLLMLLHIDGMTLCSAIGWDGFLWSFCPDWPQTTVLQISAFGVARIKAWNTIPGLILIFLLNI